MQGFFFAASLAPSVFHAALAAPAPAPGPLPAGYPQRRQDVGAAVAGAAANGFAGAQSLPIVLDLPTIGPDAALPGPSASGQLYGSEALLGPDGNPAQDDNTVPSPITLLPQQSAAVDDGLIFDFEAANIKQPQPTRGTTGKSGGTKPDTLDTSRFDVVEPDSFAPPGTDSGSVPQAVWPLGLSHNRLGLDGAGYARQENTDNLPRATEMAGVDMRLSPNAYRELHWHSAGEWSYVLNGSVRVQTVNEQGQTLVGDLNAGDLWFFPPGVPHSLQAFEHGCEFLLVFDDGAFSEEATGLVSEMFLRNPLEVLAKDLQTSIPMLKDIPQNELYIFPGTPAPHNISEQNVTGPNGFNNQPDTMYIYHFSQQEPLVIPGAGSLKIVDATTFPAAADFSAALVTIEPGAMRELHWHLQSDEWNFFISGKARITVYQPPSSSRTFDYGPGDVGYIPNTFSHYIENIGDEPVVLLEMLKQPKFTDISVSQWLGLTPRQIVKDTLHLPDAVLDNLPKYKPYLVPGSTNFSETNFTRPF